MSLRFKPDVRIGYLDERLVDVLRSATIWSLRAGVDVEINSIEDGADVHLPTSLHGVGLAVDVDTVGDRPDDLVALAQWFRRTLPAGYDVVLEADHVHVEYDVHRAAPRLRTT